MHDRAHPAAPTLRKYHIVRGPLFSLFHAGQLNSGFLDVRFSCATIYQLALLERNVPAGVLERFPGIASVVAATAPWFIFLVEAVIPPMLWLAPAAGALFTALFHWTIAIVPPPNDIASFGVATLPRVLLAQFGADEDIVRGVRAALDPRGAGAGVTAAIVAATAALQPGFARSLDVAVPLCAVFTAVILFASLSSWARVEAHSPHPPAPRGRGGFVVLKVIAMLYALVVVPLGVFEVGCVREPLSSVGVSYVFRSFYVSPFV